MDLGQNAVSADALPFTDVPDIGILWAEEWAELLRTALQEAGRQQPSFRLSAPVSSFGKEVFQDLFGKVAGDSPASVLLAAAEDLGGMELTGSSLSSSGGSSAAGSGVSPRTKRLMSSCASTDDDGANPGKPRIKAQLPEGTLVTTDNVNRLSNADLGNASLRNEAAQKMIDGGLATESRAFTGSSTVPGACFASHACYGQQGVLEVQCLNGSDCFARQVAIVRPAAQSMEQARVAALHLGGFDRTISAKSVRQQRRSRKKPRTEVQFTSEETANAEAPARTGQGDVPSRACNQYWDKGFCSYGTKCKFKHMRKPGAPGLPRPAPGWLEWRALIPAIGTTLSS